MTGGGPESCAECGRVDCRLSFARRGHVGCDAMTAFVLDAVWPEHREYVQRTRRPPDQVLAPAGFGPLRARYDWEGATRVAGIETLARHLRLRRLARAGGGLRQAANLRSDAAIAAALAARLDYRARRIVVSQTLLPHLWLNGVLGGRAFDVLMTRYPLQAIQEGLDAAAKRTPGAASLRDFRAPRAVVDAETEALKSADRLITPHADLQRRFGARAEALDWTQPEAPLRRRGTRVAFLGPTIARQGADQVREIARSLPAPLIVFGEHLEGPEFWRGAPIESRSLGPGWLDDIGSILHPALITNAPRRLLEARAAGVAVYATLTCGLPRSEWRPFESFALSASAGTTDAPAPTKKLTRTMQ